MNPSPNLTIVPPPEQAGAARLDGEAVVIERLRTEDPPLVRLVARRAEAGTAPADTVTRCLEVGARALEGTAAAVSVEHLRESLEASAEEAGRRLDEAAASVQRDLGGLVARHLDPESGSVRQTVDAMSGDLARALAERFGGGGSRGAVQEQIAGLVGEQLQKGLRELTGVLTSSEGGPLSEMRAQLEGLLAQGSARQQRELERLREGVGQLEVRVAQMLAEAEGRREGDLAAAAERRRGTAKGRDFEDRVLGELSRLAQLHGDLAHDASALASASGSKKGDALVEIEGASGPAQGSLVFEMKDTQLSARKAHEVLEEARRQRGADYALLVVRGEDCLPRGVMSFSEAGGHSMIVALPEDEDGGGHLQLAYRYARLRVRLAQAGPGADAERIGGLVLAARSALAKAGALDTALAQAEQKVRGARGAASEVFAGVTVQLDAISAALAEGARRAA